MVGMPRWTLDGIEFNAGTDSDGIEWVLEEEQGFWGSSGNDHKYTARLDRDGSFVVPGFKPSSVIALTCSAYASNRGDYDKIRWAQMRAAALCSTPETLYPLACYSEIGPLVADVRLDGDIITKPKYIQVPAFEFSVQLKAPDPRRYDLEWETVTTGLPQQSTTGLDFTTGGGLSFTTGGGLQFGTASTTSGFIQMTNRGLAPTEPIYTLHGPLTNPTLTTSEGSVTYNGTLAAGEFVEIDIAGPSVLLNGTTTRGHLVSPARFDALAIPRESTLIVGLSHTGLSTATGYVEARFRSAFY